MEKKKWKNTNFNMRMTKEVFLQKTQNMSHIRVHPQSTWGTWLLPRRFWVHPERMSKAPHPDCNDCTAPCSAIGREVFREKLWLISICPISSPGGADRVVWLSIDTGGKLQILTKLCWFHLVLPEFHPDIYFLIRHPWACYSMPLLRSLSHKTNYNRQKNQ